MTTTADPEVATLQRQLGGAGALLLTLGLFTGFWTAAALTEIVKVNIPHLALAAHLNGLLGGLWIAVVAWSVPLLGFTPVGIKRIAGAIGLACYSAWFVTLIASFVGVRGIEYTDDRTNNVFAALLQVLVVLPALVGASGWTWGFFRKRA